MMETADLFNYGRKMGKIRYIYNRYRLPHLRRSMSSFKHLQRLWNYVHMLLYCDQSIIIYIAPPEIEL